MFHAFFAGTYGWTSSLTCMLTRKISVNWHSYHSWSQRDNSNSAKQEMSPTILVTCEHDMQHTIQDNNDVCQRPILELVERLHNIHHCTSQHLQWRKTASKYKST